MNPKRLLWSWLKTLRAFSWYSIPPMGGQLDKETTKRYKQWVCQVFYHELAKQHALQGHKVMRRWLTSPGSTGYQKQRQGPSPCQRPSRLEAQHPLSETDSDEDEHEQEVQLMQPFTRSCKCKQQQRDL